MYVNALSLSLFRSLSLSSLSLFSLSLSLSLALSFSVSYTHMHARARAHTHTHNHKQTHTHTNTQPQSFHSAPVLPPTTVLSSLPRCDSRSPCSWGNRGSLKVHNIVQCRESLFSCSKQGKIQIINNYIANDIQSKLMHHSFSVPYTFSLQNMKFSKLP